MEKSTSKDKANPFWGFFRSVRLTIALLIILALVSIAGTLIPQREEAARLVHTWSPGLIQLFQSLQLFDVYHSVWFRALIGLLALNLIVCSLDRFPSAWRRYKAHERIDRSKPFEDLSEDRSFTTKGVKEDVAEAACTILGRHYRRVVEKDTPEGCFLFAEKGRYAHFGVYLIHLSVLLILMGGIIGSIFGFEAFVSIPEKEAVDAVSLRNGGQLKALGFSVLCEKFTVDFYENGAPKEYRSDITFLADGKPLLKSPLMVNHPVTFRGVTFYQASYGTIPGDSVRISISRKDREQEDPVALDLRKGEPARLPGGDAEIEVADIRSDLMRLGPAVNLHVKPGGREPFHFWVFQNQEWIRQHVPGFFQRSPRFNPAAFSPYVFSLDQVESRYYTGLQVNSDPGVPLVWAGCLLMILGFMATFFISHRRIWVRITARKGTLRVSVAGKCIRNPAGMDKEVEHITHSIREILR